MAHPLQPCILVGLSVNPWLVSCQQGKVHVESWIWLFWKQICAGVLSAVAGGGWRGAGSTHAAGSPAVLQPSPNKGSAHLGAALQHKKWLNCHIVLCQSCKRHLILGSWGCRCPERASLQLCCCPSAPHFWEMPFVKALFPISGHPEPSPPLAATSPCFSP